MTQPAEHTPAFKIFHYYYEVYVPQYALYGENYLQDYGFPTTGNRETDRAMANQRTLCQLTLAQMAEHIDNGISVILADPTKSMELYEIVNKHLIEWKQKASFDRHINVPLEDLKKLEVLAVNLYDIAKATGQVKATNSRLFGSIDSISPIKANTSNTNSNVKQQHETVVDGISKEVFSRKKSWR